MFKAPSASFQIKVLNRNNRVEVRLNFQIDQKYNTILLLIKEFLGGNIGALRYPLSLIPYPGGIRD